MAMQRNPYYHLNVWWLSVSFALDSAAPPHQLQVFLASFCLVTLQLCKLVKQIYSNKLASLYLVMIEINSYHFLCAIANILNFPFYIFWKFPEARKYCAQAWLCNKISHFSIFLLPVFHKFTIKIQRYFKYILLHYYIKGDLRLLYYMY